MGADYLSPKMLAGSIESIHAHARPSTICRRRSRSRLGGGARVAGSRRFNNPVADGHDPLVLQQFHSIGPLLGVAEETAFQEVNALRAELIRGW